MREFLLVFSAEVLKTRKSSTLKGTFLAFSIAPVMGAVFILILRDPELLAKAGPINTKVKMLDFKADWVSYFSILMQAIGVGGVLVFGFVASWIFGREYSDGTAKDLLALPTSRSQILNAKFTVYIIWCFFLVIGSLLLGIIFTIILQIPGIENGLTVSLLSDYFVTTLLTVLMGTPIAFFALWGKGYLAPLGFVGLTLVCAQVVAAIGYGNYFPWSVPGLYSGTGGEYKSQLNALSYIILLLTSVAGYGASIWYWKYSDQTK